jgi:nucleotide-binding universal stress UspA family protein
MAILEVADPGLARAVTAARGRLGGERVALRVRPGRPEPLLLEEGAEAELVVLGPPQRRLLAQLASTAHWVAARSSTPVVVVRPAPDRGGVFAGHVVVAADGSDASNAALEWGFRWAADHRRPLVAACVPPTPCDDFWYDETTLSVHFAREPAALELLAIAVEPWMNQFPTVAVKRAVCAGPVTAGLLRAARGASLLVVGQGSRGQASSTVADGVLYRAACPIAVIHREDSTCWRAGVTQLLSAR